MIVRPSVLPSSVVPVVSVLALLVGSSAALAGRGYVYVNTHDTFDDPSIFNAVYGFSVDDALTALPGSPYVCATTLASAPPSLGYHDVVATVKPDGTILVYASFTDTGSGNEIEAFTAGEDGDLAAVAGSPFASDVINPGPLAVTPAGNCLFVLPGYGSSDIATYSVGGSGALTLESVADIDVTLATDLEVFPMGSHLLVLGDDGTEGRALKLYRIGDMTNECHLDYLATYPVPAATYAMAIDPAGTRVIATVGADHSLTIHSWGFDGLVLAPTSGSPQVLSVPGEPMAHWDMAFGPDGDRLYVTPYDDAAIYVVDVPAAGPASMHAGSPYSVPAPIGTVSVTADGSYLFAKRHSPSSMLLRYPLDADGGISGAGEDAGLPPNSGRNAPAFVSACDNDGVIDPLEDCDDGNDVDWDGCTECEVDDCHVCVNEPSECRTCDVCLGEHCDESGLFCTTCPDGYRAVEGGCEKDYEIFADALDNQTETCAEGWWQNFCESEPPEYEFGFHWTDPGDASVGIPAAVSMQIHLGIQSGSLVDAYLNGSTNVLGSMATDYRPDCVAGISTHTVSGGADDYVKGGLNSVVFDDASCAGNSPDAGGRYAIVTVTYAAPASVPQYGNACDDGLYCNGSDTCSAGECSEHSGDPCGGGDDCNDTCNEATDTCFTPTDEPCAGDSNPCTDDVCDGAGACSVTNNSAACDDGNACTSGDVCTGGTCAGTPITCDDDSVCTADSCNPASGCEFAPVIRENCLDAGKSKLLYQQLSGGTSQKLKWIWSKGAATTVADLEDPTMTADYELCLYAEHTSAPGSPTFVLPAVTLPAGSLWSAAGSSGYRYLDKSGATGGITKLQLKGGDEGRAKIKASGKGAVGEIALPLHDDLAAIRVQLTNRDGGTCWESGFSSIEDTDTRLKAEAP